ncbi:MAG: arginine--tRNA ligase [Planctomycetaceae bacterium]|nr:arginine--tRNA ligase [Planctomycetaceae bacterium]
MNVLTELQQRFRLALDGLTEDPDSLLEMVRPAQETKFGDYQANCAMPLGKQLGRSPREVAEQIIQQLDVSDFCSEPEIAGPGFINLRLRDDWLVQQLTEAQHDSRLGIAEVSPSRCIVIDYSSPNVAKPMHVGHIRSTVIGDAISSIARFLGHRVISDNHLGDWGTQFGMIIYGFKHFRQEDAYQAAPVPELTRLYKQVQQLIEYHQSRQQLPQLEQQVQELEAQRDQQQQELEATDPVDKKAARRLRQLEGRITDQRSAVVAASARMATIDEDPALSSLAAKHADIADQVLEETAKLHAGDEENCRLWEEFLPRCREDIQRIYDRLNIEFDVEYGESFYHDRLPAVVAGLEASGLARESEGATCVFLDEFETPMIVRKRDGAFLYATTDLATIQYRMETWQPDAILYVVDHRQGEHFQKLFSVARQWQNPDVEFSHVSFGTVLGEDGRPFKTRSGQSVGLESLLDEALQKALDVVTSNDESKPHGAELSPEQRQQVAETVGHGAIKYADLSHNRTSDYVFSYEKMMGLEGNTATYIQYSYARVRSIFRRGEVDLEGLRASFAGISVEHPAERALAMAVLQLSEVLESVLEDYRPNQLTNYLFELAKRFSSFFEACPVLKAETEAMMQSRLLLCDLTARTIEKGLQLLGIGVVEMM